MSAIRAVVDVFNGQPLQRSDFEVALGQPEDQFKWEGLPVVGNELKLNEETIKENLRKVHDRNGLEESKELHGLNFSVEMEIFLTCYSADP